MSVLDPVSTTIGGLLTRALKDAGVLGVGQTPLAEDINDAWASAQWLLQQWARKRWMIFHNVTYTVQSTYQTTPYSVGPSGGPGGTPQIVVGAYRVSVRPNQIESAFFTQSTTGGSNVSPIVYPLRLYRAMEDYRRIPLPSLTTFPLAAFYDPAWGSSQFGQLYIWPWPNNPEYTIGIVMREQLPQSFPSLATVVTLPYEYFQAIVSNVAIAVRPKYGIGTFPGDMLPSQARNGIETIRQGSTVIANLVMPSEVIRNGNYNIFSDQTY